MGVRLSKDSSSCYESGPSACAGVAHDNGDGARDRVLSALFGLSVVPEVVKTQVFSSFCISSSSFFANSEHSISPTTHGALRLPAI